MAKILTDIWEMKISEVFAETLPRILIDWDLCAPYSDTRRIFNNYSPKAKWILVNIYRDEVEVNIHQYSLSLRRMIVLVYTNEATSILTHAKKVSKFC